MLENLLPTLENYKERTKGECDFIVSLQQIIIERIRERLSHEWQNNPEGKKFIKCVTDYYTPNSKTIIFTYQFKEEPIDISDVIEKLSRRYVGILPHYEKLGVDGLEMPLGVSRLELVVGDWRISPINLSSNMIREVVMKMFIPGKIIFGNDS